MERCLSSSQWPTVKLHFSCSSNKPHKNNAKRLLNLLKRISEVQNYQSQGTDAAAEETSAPPDPVTAAGFLLWDPSPPLPAEPLTPATISHSSRSSRKGFWCGFSWVWKRENFSAMIAHTFAEAPVSDPVGPYGPRTPFPSPWPWARAVRRVQGTRSTRPIYARWGLVWQ